MSRRIAVLRPEPGNTATAERVRAAGGVPIRLPLFEVVPQAWAPPDAADFDALLVTSANAIRHAGPDLTRYRALPVHAVGAASADAARAAGFSVVTIGEGGVAALPDLGAARVLHLTGRDRIATARAVTAVTVYASDPVPADATLLHDSVALVHSRRAGARLAELCADRARVGVVAISAAAGAALGPGWRFVRIADWPGDAAMIARALAD